MNIFIHIYTYIYIPQSFFLEPDNISSSWPTPFSLAVSTKWLRAAVPPQALVLLRGDTGAGVQEERGARGAPWARLCPHIFLCSPEEWQHKENKKEKPSRERISEDSGILWRPKKTFFNKYLYRIPPLCDSEITVHFIPLVLICCQRAFN